MSKIGKFLTDSGYAVNKDVITKGYYMVRAEVAEGSKDVFNTIMAAAKEAGLSLDEDKSFFDEASSQIFLYSADKASILEKVEEIIEKEAEGEETDEEDESEGEDDSDILPSIVS
ncbi:hypothetical protein LCGC14_0224400 [marine sediment metagenome]|uniref:Uncharacterized protein n=1 Tax=marine sediment metagenome TaxID=412755 RepID=A0A0F9WWV2_9ZZZZ